MATKERSRQRSLNFNARVLPPAATPAQGNLNLNVVRPLAGSFTPLPVTPPSPAPVTGMGILGNQAGPPQIPGSINTGMGALGNQPAAPPSIGPVDPLTNTPVTPRVITPRPVINSLTNQPVIVPQRSTLGPVPGTPAASASAPAAAPAPALAPAARLFSPGGVANTAVVGAELVRGAADTAGRTAAKMESGQGFWQGLGNTVKENLAKSADNPFGFGSVTDTVNALKEGRVPTATESNVPTRMIGNLSAQPTSSFFETPATRANEAAGGGLRGMGAGLKATWDAIKNYENPAWKAGQEVRAGFTGEDVPSTASKPTDSLLPSPAEEAARRQRMSTTTLVARPEGTATFQPGTGVATPDTQELIRQSPQQKEKERIAAIAGRISPENPYGADVANKAMLTNQIRGGALTDAEAARNLQDRALQDQATQSEVARINRATEAMKSLREARSPAFSFGTDVIGSTGGIESKLNEASGRVVNRNTPADAIASRMQEAVQSAKTRGLGRKAGLLAAAQIGKAYEADKELQGIETQAASKQPTTDPVDMARYLLDRQKFAQQQGIDKARLNIDTETMRAKQAGTALEQQEYADTQRKDFMANFTAPEGAPGDELATSVLAMSKATGLSPDVMNTYLQRVIKENNIDWENAPPKDLKQLYEKAVALAASENR